MNSDDTRTSPGYLIPFAILAISFAALLIYQAVNLSKQKDSMLETKKQFISAISQREALVKQSGELQAKLQGIVVDLLELAKTDEKAKAVVQKHGITQENNPAAPAAAPEAK